MTKERISSLHSMDLYKVCIEMDLPYSQEDMENWLKAKMKLDSAQTAKKEEEEQ